MKIGVYVGSFNPVHKGHIKIVNHLIKNKYVDKVLVIPTGNYWDKNDLISIKDRINMLKMYQNENIIIDEKHNNITYTSLIFDDLEKDDNIYSLIIGADNIVNFNKWRDYKSLLKHELIIINRSDIDVKYYINKYKVAKYKIVYDLPILDVSSTMIRNMIKNNKLSKNNRYIDNFVLEYIKEKDLYNK